MQPEAGRHGTGSRKGRKSGKKGAGESKGDGGKGLGENVKPGGKGSREKKDKTQGGGKEGGEIRGDVEGRDAEGFESQQYSALPPGPADAECKSFSSEGSTTAHLEGEEEQSVPGGDGKEVRVDVKEEPRDPPRRQTVRFAGDGREGSEIGAASGRGSQCDEGTASGPRARKGETGEGDQDESAEDDKNKMKRKSTVMAAFSRTWTQKLPKGFNCLEHLALALVGGLFGARRSFKAAQTSAHQGHYFSLFLYGLVLTCGRLFLFVLPLALLALGVTFLVKEGPYVEDINKVVRAPGKQPYWMILITGIIGSASINLVLGPPKLVDTPDRQSCWQCVGNVAKRCLTLYLLLWTLWTWGDEIWQLTKIAREQHAAGSPLARILMLAMVQSATSTQWGRYVDQIALLMVFNDYLNFKAAHHDEFVATWSKYMKDVEQAKDSLEKAMVERPLSDGDVPMEKAIARSVLDTPRLVSLIVKASETNGHLWTLYMVVLLARCWTFGWVAGLVYFPLFLCCYPWVIAIIVVFMIVLRVCLVEPLMHVLIYRQQHQGDDPPKPEDSEHPDQEAGDAGRGGQRGSVTSLHLEGTEDVIKLYRRPSDESDESDLKVVVSAMALTGFGPGHCDRAVKYLLYTTWYSEHKPAKELRENYKREIQTLRATGITRDGWCYIVMYAAVGKVMMDFIVVVMSRLLAGAGYFDSIWLTLTDRSTKTFIEQFRYMPIAHQVFNWVETVF